jgi:hypothetical protein
MKTKLAYILGLALLVMSSTCGGSLAFADALEAESSALLTLAPDANANGVESLDKLHCVFYSDGADDCIVNTQLPAVDQSSSTDEEAEPPAAEPAPAVQFVDAIKVAVTQTVTIAAPGLNPGDNEDPAFMGSISAPPAAEPVLNTDAKPTTDASLAPAGTSADAIVVAVVQSTAIAIPGQIPQGNEEAAPAESKPEPTAPILTIEAKTATRDQSE